MKSKIEDIELIRLYPYKEILSLFGEITGGSLNVEYILRNQSLFKWKEYNDEFVILDNYDDDIMYVITPNIWDFNDKIILLAENNKYRIYVLVGKK
jgi:hypothetical protein